MAKKGRKFLPPPLSDEEWKERADKMAEIYINNGFSIPKAAEEIGLGKYTGYDVAKKYGGRLFKEALVKALNKEASTAERVHNRYTQLAFEMDVGVFGRLIDGSMTLQEAYEKGLPTWQIKTFKSRYNKGEYLGADITMVDLEKSLHHMGEMNEQFKKDGKTEIGKIQNIFVDLNLPAFDVLMERSAMAAQTRIINSEDHEPGNNEG